MVHTLGSVMITYCYILLISHYFECFCQAPAPEPQDTQRFDEFCGGIVDSFTRVFFLVIWSLVLSWKGRSTEVAEEIKSFLLLLSLAQPSHSDRDQQFQNFTFCAGPCTIGDGQATGGTSSTIQPGSLRGFGISSTVKVVRSVYTEALRSCCSGYAYMLSTSVPLRRCCD